MLLNVPGCGVAEDSALSCADAATTLTAAQRKGAERRAVFPAVGPGSRSEALAAVRARLRYGCL